jgi:hypothetical protein
MEPTPTGARASLALSYLATILPTVEAPSSRYDQRRVLQKSS